VKKISTLMFVVMLFGLVLSACATPTPVTVIETVVVEKEGETIIETVEVVKEVVVTKEVEVEVPVEVATKTLVFSSRLFSPPREQEFFINEVIIPLTIRHCLTGPRSNRAPTM